MGDNSKKRSNSFRKLFPKIFFTYKTKDKSKDKTYLKNSACSAKNNYYQSSRTVHKPDFKNGVNSDSERIYENLAVSHPPLDDNETLTSSDVHSINSSSSTLVSESIRRNESNILPTTSPKIANLSRGYTNYAAKPQVPPKPQNDVGCYQIYKNVGQLSYSKNPQYPDVYYHSVEKVSEKKSELDEIEILKEYKSQANPTSVGAEIKKVCTKFLISPKKEAEVRTIQPIRARSLSFDGNNEEPLTTKSQHPFDLPMVNNKKSYNYSAPTSPIPINNNIPNMPKIVSPYGHVRKNMIEAEERKNSLNRRYNKSPLSPRSKDNSDGYADGTHIEYRHQEGNKEKTRQKVEAFYWQKLSELKLKEDEYFCKQSMNTPTENTARCTLYSNSNRNTPNLYYLECKSHSLPPGQRINDYHVSTPIYNNPRFVRGASERHTDTFIINRNSFGNSEIISRYPQKLVSRTKLPLGLCDTKQKSTMLSGYLKQDILNQSMKMNFEEQNDTFRSGDCATLMSNNNSINQLPRNDCASRTIIRRPDIKNNKLKVSPRPPIRTTSVASTEKYQLLSSKRNDHYIYSESESGSEAGEIRRILNSHYVHKGK